MSLASVALRLLLSLCLVLNGLGTVMAAGHVPMFHEAPTMKPGPTTALAGDTVAPCHGQEAAQPARADTPSAPPGPHHGAAEPDPSVSDCCGFGTCQCACLHLAQAVLPLPAPAALTLVHALSLRPLPLGRAAPALPHLIRPPIG